MKKLYNFSCSCGLFTMILFVCPISHLGAQVDLVTTLNSIPTASSENITQIDNIIKHQMGVAILGGETTKPFYFIHNGKNEEIYKYKKLIDRGKIPGAIAEEIAPFATKGVEELDDAFDFARCTFFSLFGKDCKKYTPYDTWFPIDSIKQTVCGKTTHVGICPQDFAHTQLTIDQDFNIKINPSVHFSKFNYNERLKENFEFLEGEVLLSQKNRSISPLNSILLSIKRNDDICLFGAWMADIIDLQVKGIGWDSDTKYIGHENNEIHPINQLWFKEDEKTTMIAMVDATGYFVKKDATQVEASGLNQKMSFYKAFLIPNDLLRKNIKLRYQIMGEGFKFDQVPSAKTSEDNYLLKLNTDELIEVREVKNRFKTHSMKFDQVKRRPDGSIQGYIVIETEKIRVPGGSINVTLASKPVAKVSQLTSTGNEFTKINLGAIGQFDKSQIWKSGDFNGDGKSDLLALIGNAQGSSRYTIYFSTDDSLNFDLKSGGLVINHNEGEWLVGDSNGDGKDDLINVYKNSANRAVVTTILSDGTRFADVAHTQALERYWVRQIWATADVNGDAKSDLVVVYPQSSDNTTRVKVYLAGENDYVVSSTNFVKINHNLSSNPTKVLLSDFNGDSKADISLVYGGNGKTKVFSVYAGDNSYIGQTVQRTELAGTGFDNQQHWRAGDVNGDDKSDLICVMPTAKGTAITAVHYSSGQAFMPRSVSAILEGSSTLNRYIRGDFNGDGKTDLINVMEYLPD